ncbi:MAG: glycosyl transferase family 2 [Chloroflexi bacterium]|nr:MAG: glycosyl transferase family 2 [Chloroflexota bacterium]PIE81174.1 MAG: glycosyl transferase family 2 [Chloroflexota bacterium]
MLNGKKIVIVMPAYNAEKTLRKTYSEIPHDIVDDIVLVDDASQDHTARVSKELGINTIVHEQNTGYGGNQKTCYKTAVSLGADIVIMLHPDYQYTPLLITAMASLLANGLFDCVLGSRILGVGARKGGMPLYKYISNRFLTLVQNIIISYKLSEYHTGYRGFTREILEKLPLENNSDNFIFDNQMLCQIVYGGYSIGEITCPTRYMDDSSSISFKNSSIYGLGVLKTSVQFRLQKWGVLKSPIFTPLDN